MAGAGVGGHLWRRSIIRIGSVALAAVLTAVGLLKIHGASGAVATGTTAYVPPVKHIFIINIDNKGYDATWGPTSATPYLAKTLRWKSVLLTTYYETEHNSQPNYVAQLSGRGPTPQMQGDYPDLRVIAPTATPRPGRRWAPGVYSRPHSSLCLCRRTAPGVPLADIQHRCARRRCPATRAATARRSQRSADIRPWAAGCGASGGVRRTNYGSG